jgi:hypothetical protein
MSTHRSRKPTARERQREAIRRMAAERRSPSRRRGPRGNQEAEPHEVERGLEALHRVLGH